MNEVEEKKVKAHIEVLQVCEFIRKLEKNGNDGIQHEAKAWNAKNNLLCLLQTF